MDIGILKENKGGRVLITPITAKNLIKNGNNIYFTKDCGLDSGYKNEDYIGSGCIIKETNKDVIDSSKLITSFLLPDKEILKQSIKKTFFCYSEAISNLEKIKLLSENKNTLIGIEYIEKNKDNYLIENQINNIIANIAFNIISFKYNFPEHGKSGELLNKFGFNSKKSISILGFNSLSIEIIKLLKNKNVEVFIYADIEEFSKDNSLEINYMNNLNLFPIEKINNIVKSDIIINTIRSKFKPNENIIESDLIEDIKEGCLFVDLSIKYGKVSKILKETDFKNELSYKYKNKYFICPSDITKYNGKTLSNLISNHIYQYINELINNGFKNDGLYFKNAFIVDNGIINNNIQYIESFNKITIINDPFDLIEDDYSDFFSYDDDLDIINDKLDNIDDYEIIT